MVWGVSLVTKKSTVRPTVYDKKYAYLPSASFCILYVQQKIHRDEKKCLIEYVSSLQDQI